MCCYAFDEVREGDELIVDVWELIQAGVGAGGHGEEGLYHSNSVKSSGWERKGKGDGQSRRIVIRDGEMRDQSDSDSDSV